jgi:acetyl-CoA carboxylase, biotin carboxylase subunit
MNIKKVLIANRGEIAIRVIRSCREMNISTVAVFSEADRNSLHVMLADEAYCIGPAPSNESYLVIDKIIEVAKTSGADAVHPGYGFLSENASFARKLKKQDIIFIGPTEKNIKDMGDKLSARELFKKAGVPIVPGSPGPVESEKDAIKVSKEIGFPVIIKASAGGGGKGIRVCLDEKELPSAFRACQSEGENYFNDSRVFIERFIQNPKHIEIQVFGDSHGNAVHFFDRECSVQRRHQKLIEEAPSVSVPEEVRQKMGEIAVTAAKSIKYEGAGTIEFIFDNSTKEFFFMEMNTRLQVEHPVTEMITGHDFVKEQIKVAQGKKLSVKQEQIEKKGHSIEIRVCAEDPISFIPCPGKIRRYRSPKGPFIRVDGYAYPGYKIPIYYDPMISKLIVWGKDRKDCLKVLNRALQEYMITGIKTNLVLHRNIIAHPKFKDGTYTTQFIENEFGERKQKDFFMYVDEHVFLISAAITAYKEEKRKDISKYNYQSQWKNTGRAQSMRTQ